MGIQQREVAEYSLWPSKGPFGIDHPLGRFERREILVEGVWIREVFKGTVKLEWLVLSGWV